MTCKCANQGKIPMCPESPIVKVLLPLVFTVGSYAFLKLPTQGKVLVASVAVIGVDYTFNIHNKINDLLFAKHSNNEVKLISQLPNLNEPEFFENIKIDGISTLKGNGEYKGLALFHATAENDIISINSNLHMKQTKGYISEIIDFNPDNDKIQITCPDHKDTKFIHKTIRDVDYTLVHLYDNNDYEYQLAIQGVVSEKSIELV